MGRWKNAGAPLLDRLMDRTAADESTGCLLWTGNMDAFGYGRFKVKVDGRYKDRRAHRLVYECVVGPIPEGLQLDHLCRVRRCVRPEHLEPVTQQVNMSRGVGRSAINAARTRCPMGHAYTETNTYRTPAGARECRTCLRAKGVARAAREKAERHAKRAALNIKNEGEAV